jgi:thioredoxin reductase
VNDKNSVYDSIVIGGGPAGLSAALMLARYNRGVLTFHHNNPRNAYARGIHGFLGHDGIRAEELLGRGRAEVERYGGSVIECQVDKVERSKNLFTVTAGAILYTGRTVVLATGVRDITPDIPGFLDFYGSSIHHCPDCDGYEVRGKRVGVLGSGHEAVSLIKALRVWTPELTLLTNGAEPELKAGDHETIVSWKIPALTERITGIAGNIATRRIERLRFANGTSLQCDALFFHIGTIHACSFHEALGCKIEPETGLISVGPDQQTSVPGVYAAGDITPLTRMAVVAAAQGTIAAVHIHKYLLREAA